MWFPICSVFPHHAQWISGFTTTTDHDEALKYEINSRLNRLLLKKITHGQDVSKWANSFCLYLSYVLSVLSCFSHKPLIMCCCISRNFWCTSGYSTLYPSLLDQMSEQQKKRKFRSRGTEALIQCTEKYCVLSTHWIYFLPPYCTLSVSRSFLSPHRRYFNSLYREIWYSDSKACEHEICYWNGRWAGHGHYLMLHWIVLITEQQQSL